MGSTGGVRCVVDCGVVETAAWDMSAASSRRAESAMSSAASREMAESAMSYALKLEWKVRLHKTERFVFEISFNPNVQVLFDTIEKSFY